MRPVHLAKLDKTRPVVILNRELVRPHLTHLTVAPISSAIRGLVTEVRVGPPNGIEYPSVIMCDSIGSIPMAALGRQIGVLLEEQEALLTRAITHAFDLDLF